VSNIWFDSETDLSPGKVITCKANGFPLPSLRWIRRLDNATVADNEKLLVESSNYSYICVATNTVKGRTYTVMSKEINFDSYLGMRLIFRCISLSK